MEKEKKERKKENFIVYILSEIMKNVHFNKYIGLGNPFNVKRRISNLGCLI